MNKCWNLIWMQGHKMQIRQCLPNIRHGSRGHSHQCFQLPIDKERHALGIKQSAIKCALGLSDLLSCTVNWFEKSSAILYFFYKRDSFALAISANRTYATNSVLLFFCHLLEMIQSSCSRWSSVKICAALAQKSSVGVGASFRPMTVLVLPSFFATCQNRPSSHSANVSEMS